ncbi:MAG: dihydrodipicolinate synthase family protein, partial [Alphaproteobacteria bacterium]
TWDELRAFVDCVVRTAAGRVPVFAGVTTLNTRDTIERGRALADLGADGLFVGRPMWLPLDDAGIIRYYRDVAAALPGVPLVVYDNPGAFKGKISADVYRVLAEIPEVVAAKHVGGPALEADLLAVGDRIRILPLESDWYALAEKHPDLAVACWSGNVACAPRAIAALRRTIADRAWDRAKDLSDRVNWAMAPLFPGGDLSLFMTYSIQLGHGRFAAAGLVDPGPCRPPYVEAPQEYLEGARECGRRWAELERAFTREQIAS